MPKRAVLASILQHRKLSLLLATAAALQLVAVQWWGTGFWRCAFKSTTRLPCPGCGLSTAGAAWLRGDFQEGLILHPFVPFLLIATILLLGISLLPARQRRGAIQIIKDWETRSWLSAILLVALPLYGIARMVLLLI